MPTHLEYVLMAQDAYNSPDKANKIPNWSRLREYTYQPDNQWGLGVVIYRNWCRTEYVIAYRGTDLSSFPITFANLVADLKLIYASPPGAGVSIEKINGAKKKWKNLVDQSLDFVNNRLKYLGLVSVSYTGHSLGAVIATINACKTNRRAVTFESPGCDHFLSKAEKAIATRNVTSYVHGSNFINSAFRHVGLIREIPYEPPYLLGSIEKLLPSTVKAVVSAINLYTQHSIDKMVQKFQSEDKLIFITHKTWPKDKPVAFDTIITIVTSATQVITSTAQKLGIIKDDVGTMINLDDLRQILEKHIEATVAPTITKVHQAATSALQYLGFFKEDGGDALGQVLESKNEIRTASQSMDNNNHNQLRSRL